MAGTVHQQLPPTFRVANKIEEDNRKERKIWTSSGNGKDLLWKELFRDPSKWWDNRNRKPSPRYPDFRHRVTREPLWLNSPDTPSWVLEELRSGADPCQSMSQIDAFVASIRICTQNKDLVRGNIIHDDLVQRGLLQKCSDALVIMYAKCGELGKAKELLDMHKSSSDVVTWTALIASYVHEGFGQNALDCFEQMQHEGILPDAVTYACILKACASIGAGAADKGKQIHDEIARQGLLQNNIALSNTLVHMYAKCGAVSKARQVLDGLPSRNVVSWSALMAGYTQEGDGEQALKCFEEMQCDGILPNAVTFICILKACATIGAGATDKGKQIHHEIVRQGLLQNNIVLGGALVDMYAKCGALIEARQVLNGLPARNVISWNAIIAGYTQEGHGEQALKCFEEMQHEGIIPSAVTFVCILKACASIGARASKKGKEIHDRIVREGLLQNNIVLGGALVDMYAKCGAVSKARHVLKRLPTRDVVSWNALIAGYTQEGQGEQALNCFEEMQHEGILPNPVTFGSILKACATIGSGALDKGKQVHDEIVGQGLLHNNVVLGNALVDMYAKCGAVSKARQVLYGLPSRDVISWNALIVGYTQEGQAEQALNLFEEMQHEAILPDAVTFISILNACATIGAGAFEKGKQFHRIIAREGLLQDNIVLEGALVDMYAKCGAVSKARHVLEGLPARDVVCWNALIAGYTREGHGDQALKCLEEMQHEGILPNAVTFLCILKACATIGCGALEKGKEIHDEIAEQGLLQNNVMLGNALVDMYAKCGVVSKARQVLHGLPSRDVVSWNALITGYTKEGQVEEVLNCFEEMQCEGILPNAVTCICVLNACSHRGLVEEGQALFANMSTKYGVNPNLECYTCMIDIFGRAGYLEEAVRLIHGMPSSDYSVIWHTLLGACRKCVNVDVGRWAFEQAVKLDKSDVPAYVLMANIYTAAGLGQKAENIEAMRIRNRAWKKPGRSRWIDSRNVIHEFSVEDTKHAQSKCIEAKLEDIAQQMACFGYSPGMPWVSKNISDAAKVHLLCHHSEKMALACALINTSPGETVSITKNMQMCGDCHVAISLISKIEMRTVIVTDTNIRHCFKDGKCSCDDYF